MLAAVNNHLIIIEGSFVLDGGAKRGGALRSSFVAEPANVETKRYTLVLRLLIKTLFSFNLLRLGFRLALPY